MLNNSQHYVEDCMIQEPVVMVPLAFVMIRIPLVVDGVAKAPFLLLIHSSCWCFNGGCVSSLLVSCLEVPLSHMVLVATSVGVVVPAIAKI